MFFDLPVWCKNSLYYGIDFNWTECRIQATHGQGFSPYTKSVLLTSS